jgi:hypothetical protein
VIATLVAVNTAYAQSPTLGELAKREEVRRKALKGTATVLKPEQKPREAAPPPASAAVADPAGQKPEEADPAQQEGIWRARMTALREELRRNEMFAEALQVRINSLTTDFTSRDDPYQRQKVGEERLKALAELERLKADVELAKKRIIDAEEEARRAGVPPGWLR